MKRTNVIKAVVVSLLLLSVTVTFASLGTLNQNNVTLPQPSPTQAPSPTPTTLPTQTPRPSPSVASTHLTPQTYTPIPTPSATPTPTPSPTPTPASTSLWSDKNWTIIDGTWNVTNNTLYGSDSAEALIIADNTTQTNYTVTMNTTINAGFAKNESSIVIRYVDANNFYWMGIGCWGHQYSIGRMLNGAPVEIASYGLESDVQQGVTYILNAAANGNVLTLFVNDTQVLQITDSSFYSGAFGIRTFNSSIQVLNIQ